MNATNPTLARTSVQLSVPQLAWLRKESKRIGVTLGELLRRIIDEARTSK